MWDERKQLVSDTKARREEQKKQERENKLKAGTLESGNGTPTDSKKMWSRAEIIDLKMRAKLGDRKAQAIVDDPKWQKQVYAAYAEERAK
jgi:hypothetical protein